jgi:hypothetical protein
LTITDKILYIHFKFWPIVTYLTYGLATKALLFLYALVHKKYLIYFWLLFALPNWWFQILGTSFQMSRRYIQSRFYIFYIFNFLLCFAIAKQYIELFAPVEAIKWWIEGILAGRLWRTYKILLAAPTAWCYKHRKTLFIGEVSIHSIFFLLFLFFYFLLLLNYRLQT